MTDTTQHCHRPWWKRPPVWFIAIAAIALLVWAVTEQTREPGPMSYSAFLDQVDAGNVASVTFQGTEIDGHFRRPPDTTLAGGNVGRDSFRTHVPDVGDPTLIPALRRQHVVIEVASPSAWGWLLARLPWPMVIIVGAVLIAGFVRLVRGRKAQPGAAASSMPMHGMIGLVAGLFAKERASESLPPRDGDEPKSR
jgi:ATP-dependent Zn protease